jgi:hypothetical protein
MGSAESTEPVRSIAATRQRATYRIRDLPRISRRTNPGEFVPSTSQNYPAELAMGEAAGRRRPLAVVEAARSARQAKAASVARPAKILEKDAEGKLIVVEIKQAHNKGKDAGRAAEDPSPGQFNHGNNSRCLTTTVRSPSW